MGDRRVRLPVQAGAQGRDHRLTTRARRAAADRGASWTASVRQRRRTEACADGRLSRAVAAPRLGGGASRGITVSRGAVARDHDGRGGRRLDGAGRGRRLPGRRPHARGRRPWELGVHAPTWHAASVRRRRPVGRDSWRVRAPWSSARSPGRSRGDAHGGRPAAHRAGAAALRRLRDDAGWPDGGRGRGARALRGPRRARRAAAQDARRRLGPGPLRPQQHRLRARPGQLPAAGGLPHRRRAARPAPPGAKRGSSTAASAAAPACAPAPPGPSVPTASCSRPTAASRG